MMGIFFVYGINCSVHGNEMKKLNYKNLWKHTIEKWRTVLSTASVDKYNENLY